MSQDATAEFQLVDEDEISFGIGAYVSNFSLAQDLGYDTAGIIPKSSATNAGLVRIESRGRFKDLTLEVHNRFFGVSPHRPARSEVSDSGRRSHRHEPSICGRNSSPNRSSSNTISIDSRSPPTSFADFTVGRQAITWGNSNLFPVSDFWTQFSPFETDNSQKRGVDGVRALVYPTDDLELDFVVVDRGEIDDFVGRG